MRAFPKLLLTAALILASSGAPADPIRTTAVAPESPTRGVVLDVLLAELYDFGAVGRLGPYPNGINGLAGATTSCNAGNVAVPWNAPMEETHPFIGLAMFREKDGVLEMIGQNWIKHGFFALANDQCGFGCSGQGGSILDVGCSDTYSTQNNGSRYYLGPRREVNPYTGEWEACGSFFDATPEDCARDYYGLGVDPVEHRLLVHDSDLGNTNSDGSDARYFYEGAYYVAEEDEPFNNIGWRECTTAWAGDRWTILTLGPSLVPTYGPAILMWGDEQITSPLANDDGEVIVATQVTDLGGSWRYEYAIYNWRSDRAVRSFSVPVGSASVSNVGFHDLDQDSGNDWTATVAGGAITWETDDFATDPDAPALIFQALFNFRFDSDLAPMTNSVALEIFKPGIGSTLFLDVQTPAGVTAVATGPGRTEDFALVAVEPNPFSAAARLRYSLDRRRDVRLSVVDVTGRLIQVLAAGPAPPGTGVVHWDGRDTSGARAASGIYFFRLESGGESRTARGLLIH